MMGAKIHIGDAVKWANKYSRSKGPLFHALFCDAPYEMAFMGNEWDESGVAFDPDTWEAFARVLYPGAFLFVFAGTINDDLISVAMRQAGLRKFHKMMGWAYGSGFPKASRVNHGSPKTEIFSGHRYGLQALKPAIETTLIFQKPYEGKPIDNITETGAGALNIDGGRIGTDSTLRPNGSREGQVGEWRLNTKEDGKLSGSESGRWPSNFLLLDPESARALDEQSGELKSGANGGRPREWNTNVYGGGKGIHVKNDTAEHYGDSGGASRFFFRVEEQIDEADPVRYAAKASRRERDAGLRNWKKDKSASHRYGSIRQERGPGYDEGSRARNPHPTVKPLSLCEYLAKLLLPPIEYAPRRIFVPFAGSGSEMIGANMAGWEEIEGVEITEEYIPIAEARLDYWQGKKHVPKKVEKIEKTETGKLSQLELI